MTDKEQAFLEMFDRSVDLLREDIAKSIAEELATGPGRMVRVAGQESGVGYEIHFIMLNRLTLMPAVNKDGKVY